MEHKIGSISIFSSSAEAKEQVGKYFRTHWPSQKYKVFLPLELLSVKGPFSGDRYFLDVRVLGMDQKRELTLDYPLTMISKEEADQLADSIRQHSVTKEVAIVKKKVTSNLLNQGSSLEGSEQQQPIGKDQIIMSTEQKAKKEITPYSVIRAAAETGKSKEQALTDVTTACPDSVLTDEGKKKVKQMTHSVYAQVAKKNAKPAATPATPPVEAPKA